MEPNCTVRLCVSNYEEFISFETWNAKKNKFVYVELGSDFKDCTKIYRALRKIALSVNKKTN